MRSTAIKRIKAAFLLPLFCFCAMFACAGCATASIDTICPFLADVDSGSVSYFGKRAALDATDAAELAALLWAHDRAGWRHRSHTEGDGWKGLPPGDEGAFTLAAGEQILYVTLHSSSCILVTVSAAGEAEVSHVFKGLTKGTYPEMLAFIQARAEAEETDE